MSQNMPPNPPGQHPESDPDDYGPSQNGDNPADNPYFARRQAAPTPDLDAGAPSLRSAEMQKMNRKALMFLGAVVFLLLVMGYFVIRSLTNRNDQPTEKVKEEQVVVPALPTDTPPLPPEQSDPLTQPIEVVQTPSEVPILPPPIAPTYTGSGQQSLPDIGPRGPTLAERRMLNAEGASGAGDGGPQTPEAAMASRAGILQQILGQQPASAEQSVAQNTSAKYLNNPDTLLMRGTYLRCALETRIITDVPGFTSCVLTSPVYSMNGRRLLLPKGSKLLGSYGATSSARNRIAVVWDRIVTPTGVDVSMSSPGIDNLGGAGHPGDYDAHWASRITSAMLISLMSDAFKYAAQKHGPPTTITYPSGIVIEQPFESNTAKSIQDLAAQALEESGNRKPTVTINQGMIVTVYVSKDVDFSRVVAAR